MDTERASKLREKLQSLMSDELEEQTAPPGSQIAYLIDSLEHDPTTEQTAVSNSVMTPPKDEKYLQSDGFHYTSSFQVRPHADYFDFDTEYNESRTVKNASEESHLSPEYEMVEAPDLTNENNESEIVVDEENVKIQVIIDKLNLFKEEFHSLIKKMDEASVVSSVERKRPSPSTTENPPKMTKLVEDILDSLHNLQPSNNTVYAEKLEDGTLQNSASQSGFLQTLSLASTEDDPCAHLPNFGVILIKSPTSVSQLWNEYTKLPSEWSVPDMFNVMQQQQQQQQHQNPSQDNFKFIMKRKTSIQALESKYGSSWRNSDKNFSRQVNRRKKIWCAIEAGLKDGLNLHECFSILEIYVKKRGKGLSWYYNGVPFKLAEMRSIYNDST